MTASAARNNETARLYAKYGEQLYRYCLARLRSREEAEDALQSAFLRVHGALEKGVTPRSESAWLYQIAHNVCLTRSEVNVRRARNEQPTDFADVELAAPESSYDAIYGLEEAVAALPMNLREPLVLREWQGLSYAEIATALGTSVSAIETLIFRARRQLIATLRPTGPAGIIDLGTLYGAVRVLLARLRGAGAAAGPSKLAVGAAALAIGGAGVSTAVTVAGDRPAHRPASAGASPLAASANTAAPTARLGRRAVLSPAIVRRATTGRPGGHTAAKTAVPLDSISATAAPASANTPVADPSVATATNPAAASPASTTQTRPATPVVPVAAAVTTPAVTTPLLTTPVLTIPLATIPSVTAPTVTVPSVTIPVPPVHAPTLPVTVSAPVAPLPLP